MDEHALAIRLATIEAQINGAKEMLDECANDLEIQRRVESANAREIEKLKRHVAKLQHDDPALKATENIMAPSAN